MPRPSDSRRVGKLLPRRGPSRQVYQARRELTCSRCGATIAVDEGFTRGSRQVPVCGSCRPLELYRHDRWGPAAKRQPPPNVRTFRDERR
jgi:hypothetical protein